MQSHPPWSVHCFLPHVAFRLKLKRENLKVVHLLKKSLLSAIFSPWCLIIWTLEIFKVYWSVSACCECRYWCNGSGSWSPLSCVKNYRFWERERSWAEEILFRQLCTLVKHSSVTLCWCWWWWWRRGGRAVWAGAGCRARPACRAHWATLESHQQSQSIGKKKMNAFKCKALKFKSMINFVFSYFMKVLYDYMIRTQSWYERVMISVRMIECDSVWPGPALNTQHSQLKDTIYWSSQFKHSTATHV